MPYRFADVAHFVSSATGKAIICKERRKARPKIPRAFADLGQFFGNYGAIANIYLGQINGTNPDAIGYVFGSRELFHKLNEATELYIDGTFAVSMFILYFSSKKSRLETKEKKTLWFFYRPYQINHELRNYS